MQDILTRANALGSEFNDLNAFENEMINQDGTVQVKEVFNLYKMIKKICITQQTLIVDLTESILTNAYVRATIQDSVITSLDASVKPSNTVPANPIVSATPDSRSCACSARR